MILPAKDIEVCFDIQTDGVVWGEGWGEGVVHAENVHLLRCRFDFYFPREPLKIIPLLSLIHF